jgi:hypothetical protein
MLKTEKSQKDIVRIQFDVRRAQLSIIDQLVEECGLSSKKELFNNSMALMKWAVQETKKGRRIASYGVENDDIEMVALPALDFMEKPQPNKIRPVQSGKRTTSLRSGMVVT